MQDMYAFKFDQMGLARYIMCCYNVPYHFTPPGLWFGLVIKTCYSCIGGLPEILIGNIWPFPVGYRSVSLTK